MIKTMLRTTPLVCALLAAACSSEPKKVDPQSALGRSIAALGSLPLDFEVKPRQDTGDFDPGVVADGGTDIPDPTDDRELRETNSGQEVLSGLSNGLTGTAAGNGGVGSPTGAGNGGVGNPTGAGNGGVPYAGENVPPGGVPIGPSSSSLAALASVVCDLLGSICISITRCSSEELEGSCDFDRGQCGQIIEEALVSSETPIYVSAAAIEAVRCFGTAIESACVFDPANASVLESRFRACGIVTQSSSTTDDLED